MDATPFEWFGDDQKYSLHGAIDDATGKVTGLYMCKNECLQGYLETTRQMILNHGMPTSIYADRHTIFRSPKADKISVEDQLKDKVVNDTQFGRAMSELGVTIIPARSPQAKGRIEQDKGHNQYRSLIYRSIFHFQSFDYPYPSVIKVDPNDFFLLQTLSHQTYFHY